MTAVSAGRITQEKQNTHRRLIKLAAQGETGVNLDQDGTTAQIGVDLTLAGELDTEIEVIADALSVADAP